MVPASEIERAQRMAAHAFNVPLDRVVLADWWGGDEGRAKRCVYWILQGAGYRAPEIARAFRTEPQVIRDAIRRTEAVLKIHPEKKRALAA